MLADPKNHILFVEEGYQRSSRAIKRAVDLGYRVSLVSGSPTRYCGDYLLNNVVADTFDIDATISAANHIDSISQIHGVVTVMERLPAVAAVASSLHLPGLSLRGAEISQNKFLCRQILRQAGIKQPKFEYVNVALSCEQIVQAADEIGYPCVLKPVGGAGGGAVFVIRSRNEIENAFKILSNISKYHKKSFGYFPGEAIIEEYLPGTQFSLDGFVTKNTAKLISVTEKFVISSKIESMHLVPGRVGKNEHYQAEIFLQAIVSALGISDTMLHVEAVLGACGWQLIEVNARMGGGCIATDLIPLAYKFDMVDAMCRIATSQAITTERQQTGKFASSTLFRGSSPGRVISIDGEAEARSIQGVIDIVIEHAIQYVSDLDFLPADDRLGAIIIEGASAIECIERGHLASEKIVVRTEPIE